MTSAIRRSGAFGLVVTCSFILIGVSGGAGAAYGPAHRNAITVSVPSSAGALVERPISDAAARALVARSIGGGAAASHMVHRVTRPLAVTSKVRYDVETTSSNWGGYVVSTQPAEGSFAEFTNPSINSATDVASWSGVGGFSGNTVLQSGVDSTKQLAWTETFPDPPTFWFPTRPGDKLLSDVQFDFSTGDWFLYIGDKTTNVFVATEVAFPGADQGSAEWITEVQGGVTPAFGSIQFFNSWWLDATHTWDGIERHPSGTTLRVTLVNPRGGRLNPSNVDSTNTGFVNFSG